MAQAPPVIDLVPSLMRRINDYNEFDRPSRHLYTRDCPTHETYADYLD